MFPNNYELIHRNYRHLYNNILQKCLKRLNISNNKMTTLNDIANFNELEILEAKNNLFEDIEDLTQTISTLISLRELYMNGNPVVQKHRYKESLIANSNTLGRFIVYFLYLVDITVNVNFFSCM